MLDIIIIRIVCILSVLVQFSQCSEDESARFFFNCKVAEESCPNEDVTFWLYTRLNEENPYQLNLTNPETINDAPFVQAPFVVLAHGYTGHRDFSPNKEIRPALFQHADYNVISVDFGPLVPHPCYLSSVMNLKVAANCTAMLIDSLVEANRTTTKDFHAIGFSLGAHMVGMIGNFLRSGKLARVTALDPARPLFITAAKEDRIDPTDADFVDVIHTDTFGRGLLLPTGHVDFYVNGGYFQPGCASQTDMTPGSCNHVRAPIYFAESINSEKGFWGYKCPHWYAYIMGICRKDSQFKGLMGMFTPTSTRGLYFVETNDEPPYAKGEDSRMEEEDDPEDYPESDNEVDK